MGNNNEGIIVSGGAFNAGQVSVGKGAQAVQNTYKLASELDLDGESDIAQTITELIKVVETYRSELNNYDELAQNIQQVAEEIKKEQPNKFTLKGLLDSIKESIGSTVEILNKVKLLQKSIAVFTGITIL